MSLDGDDQTHVSAGWGRSGKRLILTVAPATEHGPNYDAAQQALLTPEQAAELGRFLLAGPDA
jgi:hypothetical protein